MPSKKADTNVNWQQRASEFAVGDSVVPYGFGPEFAGTVLAVWPGIGMVDVEFSYGSKRYPVEYLQLIRQDAVVNEPVETDSVPGGAGSYEVSGGPFPSANIPDDAVPVRVVERVAKAHQKRAIYWAQKDRKYRATKSEQGGGPYLCPKCGASLKKAIYKRVNGSSDRLWGCPVCMFLIKRDDIMDLGFPSEVT